MTDFNGPRDVPALWGLAKTAPYFWDGSVRTLNAAILRPVKGHMSDFVERRLPTPDRAQRQHRRVRHARPADRVAALVAYVKTLDPPATRLRRGHAVAPRRCAARSSSRARAAASSATAARCSRTTSSTTRASRRSRFKSPYRAAAATP